MARLAFSKPFILLISIYFFVDFTTEDHVKFVSIDIPNQISPTPFDTFTNENDLNGARSIKNQPKSRRKRYVAFPEGSSFSVIVSFKSCYLLQKQWRTANLNFR